MVTQNEVVEVLKNYYDPELGIDIYTLGLVYRIDFNEVEQDLKLAITFTSPLCPFGPQMVSELKTKFQTLGLVTPIIDVVYDPPWKPSDEVRQLLGL